MNDTTQNTQIYESAKIAAKWWRQQIETPKFDAGKDTGFPELLMGLAVAQENSIPDKTLDAFESELAAIITETINDSVLGLCELYVDYDPNTPLQEAANAAGLRTMRWSWKTDVEVTRTKVTVSKGYGAPYTTIYHESEGARDD